MARTRLGILRSAPILCFLGVGLATLSVSDPGSHLALAMIGLTGIFVTLFLARMQRPVEAGAFLLNLMLLGLAVRFLVFSVLHQTVGPYVFAPDQSTYEGWGMAIVRYVGEGALLPEQIRNSFQIGYPVMNAVLFAIFGEARAAPAALNMLLSVWTAIPVYHLVRHTTSGREKVARLAAGLTIFFPSMVLWSTLNIREAPTILIIVMVAYFFVRIQDKPDAMGMVGVLVALVLLTTMRQYLTTLVGVAGAAGVVMGHGRSPIRSLGIGIFLMIALTFVAQNLGLGASLVGEPSLERAQVLRESFQYGAGSAYGQGADVSTPGGALAYLPIGLVYFLLAPFPWSIGSILQALTLPETLLWWALLPFGLWGGFLILRRRPGAYAVPLAILTLVTFAYAMVESNVGTAYRHRGQILPLAFIFCAIGLQEYFSRRKVKRDRRAERRRRAAEAVRVPFPPRAP